MEGNYFIILLTLVFFLFTNTKQIILYFIPSMSLVITRKIKFLHWLLKSHQSGLFYQVAFERITNLKEKTTICRVGKEEGGMASKPIFLFI